MENYENKIMELLGGETPKEKYESLLEIIDMAKDLQSENDHITEVQKGSYLSIPLGYK